MEIKLSLCKEIVINCFSFNCNTFYSETEDNNENYIQATR
jgi:hypothetical protein